MLAALLGGFSESSTMLLSSARSESSPEGAAAWPPHPLDRRPATAPSGSVPRARSTEAPPHRDTCDTDAILRWHRELVTRRAPRNGMTRPLREPSQMSPKGGSIDEGIANVPGGDSAIWVRGC